MNMSISDRTMQLDTALVSRGAAPSRPGPMARLANAVKWVARMPQRQAVIDELEQLSDRELADIGLSRADVPRVFDRAFADERRLAA